MSGSAPWIVGAVISVLVALLGANGVLVERMRRRSTEAAHKLTDTGLALTGFKELVDDIRHERDAYKADLATERADRKAEVTELKKEIARLKRGARNDKT